MLWYSFLFLFWNCIFFSILFAIHLLSECWVQTFEHERTVTVSVPIKRMKGQTKLDLDNHQWISIETIQLLKRQWEIEGRHDASLITHSETLNITDIHSSTTTAVIINLSKPIRHFAYYKFRRKSHREEREAIIRLTVQWKCDMENIQFCLQQSLLNPLFRSRLHFISYIVEYNGSIDGEYSANNFLELKPFFFRYECVCGTVGRVGRQHYTHREDNFTQAYEMQGRRTRNGG